MGTEIDRLEVQVEAQATKASAQLDILVKKLNNVSASLSGVNSRGLATMGAGVNKLANAMNNFANNTKTTDFSRLSRNLAALGQIDTSTFSKVAGGVTQLTTAINSIGNISDSGLQVAEFTKSISKLGGANVQRAITNLPALATALNDLMATLSKAPQVSSNVIQMTNALANLSSGVGGIRPVSSDAKAGSDNFKKLSASMDILTGKSKKASSSLRSFSQIASGFYAKILLLTRGIKKFWIDIESSMDYVETFNYWNVTLDKIGKEFEGQFADYGYDSADSYVNSFADRLRSLTKKMTGYEIGEAGDLVLTAGKNLGLDPEQLMSYQAKILAVTNSVGLMGETSTNTAKALSMLSADLSSFTNEKLSTVMTNMQSGLIGQSRALYKYGIDITNATLQQYAYENGITKSITAMTQAEKMQLRLLAILDQSKVAWGDQANTLNSVANSYRILGQQVGNLGRTLGNLLLPVVKTVLPVINGMVIALNKLFTTLGFKVWGADWLKDLQDGISSGFDNSGLDDIADSVDDTTGALDEASNAAKKLNGSLQAFDELNVINTKTDSGSGSTDSSAGTIDLSGAISAALADYESVWEKAFADSENKAQEYADIIIGVCTDMWNAVEPFRNAISNLWDNGLSKLADFTWTSLGDFYDNFLIPIGTWAFGTEDTGITRLVNVVNDGLMSVDWERINASLKNFWIAIEPYAEQFGEGLIDFFEDVQGLAIDVLNAFPGFLDKLTDAFNGGDPEKARDWGYALGQLAVGIIALKGIASIVSGIAALGNAFATLSSGFGALFGNSGLFATMGAKISGTLGALTTEGGIFGNISLGSLAGATTAIAALVAGLTYAYQTNEEVRQSFSNAVNAIQEGLQPAIEFLTGTLLPDLNAGWDRLMEILSPLEEFLSGMFTSVWQDMINPALTYIGENVLPKVTEAFENLWNNVLVPLGELLGDVLAPVIQIVSDVLSMLWQNVVVPLAGAIGSILAPAFDAIIDIFGWLTKKIEPVIEVLQFLWNGVLSPIVNYLWDTWKPIFEDVFEAIGGIIDGLGTALGGVIDFVAGVFTADWEKAWEGVKDIFKGIFNGLISIVEGVINIIVDGLNGFLGKFDGIVTDIGDVIGIDISIPEIPKVDLPKFSLGGFPEDGLFLANHNELVGQFSNGKTAVANNQQITDGIAIAVQNANSEQNQLLRQQNELLQAILQKPNIGNDDVFNAARAVYKDKATRRYGSSSAFDPVWG